MVAVPGAGRGRRGTGRGRLSASLVLRNALQHAMREELVSRNVAKLVRVSSPRYRLGKSLTVEQARALLAAAEGHRLCALSVVAATMGLRRGELLACAGRTSTSTTAP
jgi:integrase